MFIVTKEIDSENIRKLCRTCLREDGEKMVCLFSGPAGSSLAAKLRTLSCLEVWQGDGLPEKLCDRCVTRAESALLYREQCQAADSALRQAASKVCRASLDTTLSGSKIYHQKQDFLSLQNSNKSFKCVECTAQFSTYQELCIHARAHMSYVQGNRPVQHMNIVEPPMGYMSSGETINKSPEILSNSFVSSRLESLSAMKNDLASCALYCSLCNHTFTDRAQLVNHHRHSHADHRSNSCGDEDSNLPEESKMMNLENRNFPLIGGSNAIENLSYQQGDESRLEAINYSMVGRNSKLHSNLENTNFPRRIQDTIENLSYRDGDRSRLEAINYSSSHMNLQSSNVVNTEELSSLTTDREVMTSEGRISPADLSCDTENDQLSRFSSFDDVEIHRETNMQEFTTKIAIFKNQLRPETMENTKNTFRCDLCDKTFSQKSKLLSHNLRHTADKKPFSCPTCEKSYSSRSKLNAHVRLHTQTNVHRCEICDKTFAYPSYLAEHAKTHEKKVTKNISRDYECTLCGKHFRLLKNLKVHLRLHSGKGVVRCEICHKVFGQKYSLKVHLRTHGGTAAAAVAGKIHKCNYCGKTFGARGNYVEHLRIHTRIKPFKCRICNKSFSQSSHLKTHELSHNSVRAHQCRLCGKRYKLAAHLRRHANTHTSLKSHKCELCNQMFSQAFSLKRHLKRHSEAQI